jgi:cytochrome c peroxidase
LVKSLQSGALSVALCLLLASPVANSQAPGRAWLPAPLEPRNNPSSAEKVALGKRLFNDPALSQTRQYSCASCHQPDSHFTDGRPLALGATGDVHSRHTPTLYNSAYNASFGWDDRGLNTLEAQHLIPLLNQDPIEMGFSTESLDIIKATTGYRADFGRAFPAEGPLADAITLDNLIKAIASYVRTIRPPLSAWDNYLYYDKQSAMSDDAKAGMSLFFSQRLGCSHCHSSFNFSGPVQHAQETAPPVFHNTRVAGSNLAFRAPTLRAIRHTAPYMHAGQFASLRDVLHHYENTHADRVPRFRLSESERIALIAFLEAL